MSVSVLNRKGRRARHGLPGGTPTVFVIRRGPAEPTSPDADTRVPYSVGVAVRVSEIDREEWSRVIQELLATEANGNRTELARLIGVDYQTIRRWIAGTNRVSEDNVRTVARAFRLNVTELLVRVGHYQAGELTSPAEAAEPDARDKVMGLVKDAKLRPSVKRELYEVIRERREQFEQQLTAEIERLIAVELRARRTA